MRLYALLIAFILAFVTVSPVLAQNPQSPKSTAGKTCGSFQTLCAARCKKRAPTDAQCVADHCTPKLDECVSNGCWQEGKLYGGKLTCNLVKSRS